LFDLFNNGMKEISFIPHETNLTRQG